MACDSLPLLEDNERIIGYLEALSLQDTTGSSLIHASSSLRPLGHVAGSRFD